MQDVCSLLCSLSKCNIMLWQINFASEQHFSIKNIVNYIIISQNNNSLLAIISNSLAEQNIIHDKSPHRSIIYIWDPRCWLINGS